MPTTRLALAALMIATPALSQAPNDPFPDPIEASEGSVNLRAALAQYLYAELPRIPVSARDHQSRGVVVPQVQSQFPGRGGSPRGARDHGHLRDDPAVVPDVRDRLRSTAAFPGGRQGDTWHLDELFIRIQGRQQYLWRAVDEDGDEIDIRVQPRRNRRAAIRFFRKLLKTQGGTPRRLITDKRPSDGAAPHRDAVGRASYRSVRQQPSRGLT